MRHRDESVGSGGRSLPRRAVARRFGSGVAVAALALGFVWWWFLKPPNWWPRPSGERSPGTTTGWGTWVLDPESPSELLDTVGFWRVVPVAGETHTTDVFYSTRIVPGDWLARLVGEWFVDDTLRTVVKGLKSRAEDRANGYSK